MMESIDPACAGMTEKCKGAIEFPFPTCGGRLGWGDDVKTVISDKTEGSGFGNRDRKNNALVFCRGGVYPRPHDAF